MLKEEGIRVELDDRNEKLGYKMRESTIRKIPFTLILGNNERDERKISYRRYKSEETTTVTIEEMIDLLKEEIEIKKNNR